MTNVSGVDFSWLEVGGRLRGWREAAGLSQEALAEKAGLTQSGLHRIEAGQTNPQLETLVKLAAAFGRPVRELFCGAQPGGSPQLNAVVDRVARIISSGNRISISILENGLVGAEAVLEAGRNRSLRLPAKVDPSIFKGRKVVTTFGGRRNPDYMPSMTIQPKAKTDDCQEIFSKNLEVFLPHTETPATAKRPETKRRTPPDKNSP